MSVADIGASVMEAARFALGSRTMWHWAERLRPRGALWHNQDFRRLWAAQTVSQFGSEITGLALPLVAILVLGASTFEVAALAVVDWLPFFLFSLPAGVWIDRLPRRPILIAADLGRAAVLGSIPLAYVFDVLTLGQLYVVGLVAGTFTVFFDLSYQSYLPSVVERDQLGEGNSKLEVSRSSAQVAGPGLAGLLVSGLTAPYAILVDAISFLGSALFLSRAEACEVARGTPGVPCRNPCGAALRAPPPDPAADRDLRRRQQHLRHHALCDLSRLRSA
jgi:MFS family permease